MTHSLDSKIAAEFAAGYTIASIAASVGRHPDTVRNRVKALGLGHHSRSEPYTPEDDAKMLEAYADGVSLDEIAFRMGRTRKSIASRLCRIRPAELKMSRARPWAPEDDETIQRLRSQGKSLRQIGAVIQRSREAVSMRLSALKYRDPDAERHVDVIRENRDDEYVALCVAHGGFVRLETVRGRAYWITPDLPARPA